ncbi:MAG: putative membrane protein YedE/YeeE [Psychrobacter glaciei]|jgi:uncharacterized membrane protein YedE/YeeE
MSKLFIALLSGLLFGAGLAASDMNNPDRVQGFLDVFGDWDPSLMFVMGGALLLAIPGFQLILRFRSKPVLGKRFYLPLSKAIDKDLILGAVLFGMGWAIVGYCPGPAIAALGYGYKDVFIFVGAMLLGAKIHLVTKKA